MPPAALKLPVRWQPIRSRLTCPLSPDIEAQRNGDCLGRSSVQASGSFWASRLLTFCLLWTAGCQVRMLPVDPPRFRWVATGRGEGAAERVAGARHSQDETHEPGTGGEGEGGRRLSRADVEAILLGISNMSLPMEVYIFSRPSCLAGVFELAALCVCKTYSTWAQAGFRVSTALASRGKPHTDGATTQCLLLHLQAGPMDPRELWLPPPWFLEAGRRGWVEEGRNSRAPTPRGRTQRLAAEVRGASREQGASAGAASSAPQNFGRDGGNPGGAYTEVEEDALFAAAEQGGQADQVHGERQWQLLSGAQQSGWHSREAEWKEPAIPLRKEQDPSSSDFLEPSASAVRGFRALLEAALRAPGAFGGELIHSSPLAWSSSASHEPHTSDIVRFPCWTLLSL